MSDTQSWVEVALPLPIHRTFTYSVHGPSPPPGTRVLVSFRRDERVGWVIGPGEAPTGTDVKPVLSVLDPEPSVRGELLELCRWMADYYVAPLGIALRAALPAVLSDPSRNFLTLLDGNPTGLKSRERRLVEALAAEGGVRRVKTLRRSLSMGSIWPEIRSLRALGVLDHRTVPPAGPTVKKKRVVHVSRELGTLLEREEVFGRAKRQREAYEWIETSGGGVELAHLTGTAGFSRSVIQGLEEKGLVLLADEEEHRDPFKGEPAAPAPQHTPSAAQADALRELVAALDEDVPDPFLLQGITGSGKTLVYIELLREVLKRGKSAIVLVPEIALTPQTVSRFRAHFGDQVAVLHSGLSDGERYDAWRALQKGDRRVAVGARSALFAPLTDLGAIVVDEEHDGSYKQSEAPRYQARDLAVVRARATGAVCVLGSATPSLESHANCLSGKFRRLLLPERVGGGRLPEVAVVDLREGRARKADPSGAKRSVAGDGVLSEALVDAVRARLRRREQVILLLNRRGYSSFVQCRECGEVERCENCSISLTFHRGVQRIVCHHCRFEAPAPSRCTRCGSKDLSYRGLGTEQVERVTTERFPSARIARMDVDTTSGKWAHRRILERFERHEVDILLGTQMIAKGLDFPRVTLVGVINADVGINLPDFRASERTFQLMSQVAGRAGRSELAGEVIIQTSLPEHYAIRAAVLHDYEGFARRELEERSRPGYPPHLRLINVVTSSPDAELAAAAAERAADRVRGAVSASGRGTVVVGPAPSPIERLHGRWRWHFLMKSESPGVLSALARDLVVGLRLPSGDVRLALDRDPVALL